MGTDVTPDELVQLPAVLDVATAAEVLGVSRTCAYELVRSGRWPTPVLHLGRTIRIPSRPLVELIHAQADPQLQPATTSA